MMGALSAVADLDGVRADAKKRDEAHFYIERESLEGVVVRPE